MKIMKKMATIVDEQNEKDPAYNRSGRSVIQKCQIILKIL